MFFLQNLWNYVMLESSNFDLLFLPTYTVFTHRATQLDSYIISLSFYFMENPQVIFLADPG